MEKFKNLLNTRYLQLMTELKDLIPKALRTGTIAWLLHRITGILLIPLAFIHIYYTVYYTYTTGSPPLSREQLFILYELTLAAGVYHTVNGFRVVLTELGIGAKRHLAVIRICFLIALVIFIYGTALFWQIFLK